MNNYESPHPDASNPISFHLKTLWLFTRSDFKAVIFPQIIFALANVLSGNVVQEASTLAEAKPLIRIFYAVSWLWIHLLVEDIANQRLELSIVEDSTNKPWRPLHSCRITSEGARHLLFGAVFNAILISSILNVVTPSLSIITLTWMYNDLDGANHHFLIRNVLNAGGLLSFGGGATLIISGTKNHLTDKGYQWFAIMGAVIATTIHVQDLADVEGDAARHRRTIPLVMGQRVARWSAASFVVFWTLACASYWCLKLSYSAFPVIAGTTLAALILTSRDVRCDKMAWKFWCLWIAVLYLSPLSAN